MKKVLLIAPSYMDLYKDIIQGLNKMGFEVSYIPNLSYMEDPYNIRGLTKYSKFLVCKSRFDKKIKNIWNNLLNSEQYSGVYDYLLVLDGQSLHPCIFEILRKRNPQIKCVNYLFDTTRGVYQFQKNFNFFDEVFSFDHIDAKTYNLRFLPLYWIEESQKTPESYDVFGMGAINVSRYNLFEKIKRLCEKLTLSFYLKLYNFVNVKNFKIYDYRHRLMSLLGFNRWIPSYMLKSDLVTRERIAPVEFRRYISISHVILDTSAPHQDGLTARFMWALGAEKKIITTNNSVKDYPFYTKEQILIYSSDTNDDEIEKFITTPFAMPEYIKDIVSNYRLDNWLKTLLLS